MRVPAHIAPQVQAAWAPTMASRVLCVLCVMSANYNATLGVLLLIGGERRIQSASFAVIRDLGGHLGWGIALLVVAAVMAAGMFGSIRVLAAGLTLASVLHLAVAGSFAVAAIRSDDASLTGPPSYLLIAAAHAVVAGYHWYCAPPLIGGAR